MGTTTDRQGNLHATTDGRFTEKWNARPNGLLVPPRDERVIVSEVTDAFGIPVAVEVLDVNQWSSGDSAFQVVGLRTFRIASDDPADEVIAEFDLPEFQSDDQEIRDGEAAKRFNQALAEHYEARLRGVSDEDFVDELKRRIGLCTAAAEASGMTEPEDWDHEAWEDGGPGLPFLVNAKQARFETIDGAALGLDGVDEVFVAEDGVYIKTQVPAAELAQAAGGDSGDDPAAVLEKIAAEHSVTRDAMLDELATQLAAHYADPLAEHPVTFERDAESGGIRMSALEPYEREAVQESVQAVAKRRTSRRDNPYAKRRLAGGAPRSQFADSLEAAFTRAFEQLMLQLLGTRQPR